MGQKVGACLCGDTFIVRDAEQEIDRSPKLLNEASSDEDEADNFKSGAIATSSTSLKAEPLSRVKIAERMHLAALEAAELIGVSEEDATLLLRRYGWSMDDLSETFFADPLKARREAGLLEMEGEGRATASTSTCGICFAGPPVKVLPCGHDSYCEDCWIRYVTLSVQEGNACLSLTCPAEKCDVRLRPCDFRRLLGDRAELLERYHRFELDAYVDACADLAWCPGPRCDMAMSIPRYVASATSEIQCVCGTTWCAVCQADSHQPVQCAVVQEWARKRKDGVSLWIQANTKPCPKCKRSIEKNGGCMHMTCPKEPRGCGHEFCWLCLGDWKTHGSQTGGFYACNRFEAKVNADADKLKKEEQLRYNHHLERFQEHEKAQHWASTTQRDQVNEFSGQIQKANALPVKQVEFLDAAVAQIVAGRRFLKWTYAYGYVSKDDPKDKELFEFHQAQLEGTLERLCDVMENTPWAAYTKRSSKPARSFEDIRAQVLSLTDVVQRNFRSLADGLNGDP